MAKRKKKNDEAEEIKELNQEYLYELFALNDFVSQYSYGSNLLDIDPNRLFTYLKNPQKYIKEIRMLSVYAINKYGILKDVLRTQRNLLTLNGHLIWSSFEDVKKIKRYERKVYDFLDNLNYKKLVRQGIFEQSKNGTVVTVLRNNKYVQFIDMDNIVIKKQKNGKWIPQYDVSLIKGRQLDIDNLLNSLPPEIKEGYLAYKNNQSSQKLIEINNAEVISLDEERNCPESVPYVFPALGSLIQKDLVDKIERSNADILTKKMLILYAGSIGGKDNYKPTPKPVVEFYFSELKKLLQKRTVTSTSDDSGIGAYALPDYMKLEPLDINITNLTKDVYAKIENDIFANLGFPKSLVYGSGDGNSYGTESLAVQKVYANLFATLEDWESLINSYVNKLLPSDLNCKFYFDRTTILDREKDITAKKDLYMQTGIAIPWIEAVIGQPYYYTLGIKEYQDKVLKLQDLLYPPQNAYTSSGGDGGRPNSDNVNDGNMKSKANKSNEQPSQSD